MSNLHEISEREIRSLWLREPFATLMLHGKCETRSWKTNYRGLVLICSSLKAYEPARLRAMCGDQLAHEIRTLVRPDMRSLGSMPTGGVAVCLAELIEVRRLREDDAHFINWNGSSYWQEEAYAQVNAALEGCNVIPYRDRDPQGLVKDIKKQFADFDTARAEGLDALSALSVLSGSIKLIVKEWEEGK